MTPRPDLLGSPPPARPSPVGGAASAEVVSLASADASIPRSRRRGAARGRRFARVIADVLFLLNPSVAHWMVLSRVADAEAKGRKGDTV